MNYPPNPAAGNPYGYHQAPPPRGPAGRHPYGAQRQGSLMIGAGSLVLLVAVVLLAAYFVHVRDAAAFAESQKAQPAGRVEVGATAPASGPAGGPTVPAPVAVTAPPAASSPPAEISAPADLVTRSVEIEFDGKHVSRVWGDLGVALDPATGAPMVDRARVEAALLELKSHLDRAPLNARMDLEARKVFHEQPGFGIEIFGAVSAIEAGARAQAKKIVLEGAPIPPSYGVAELGIEDISTVLGHYETKFAIAEKARNDNLKLLASHMDGVVLRPGQEISFNKISGDRTEKEGYKVAHVIEAGEMVDGMAGGACQISTTMHGAAFFAGLDILATTPHSRPSTYVPLGFDSTVVYPAVDLKLRNPYDFSVVVHYRVARGEAEVEILGKQRPFDKVEFMREVVEQTKFQTVTREDATIPVGHMMIDQAGFPGYKINRFRNIYRKGKVIKKNKWVLNYRPVVEYVRIGINPDPNLPAPKEKPTHMIKPAKGTTMKIVQ
ncbi:MAG TPA: VanW family protein [Kofleriaceae bacterium]|nr:VanW family protein [Kofleriaceae bacterium]